MPKDFSRTRRVAELIQHELARLIDREVKDPRLGLVTLTAVEVTRDLAHAKVFVTFMDTEDAERVRQQLKVLQGAARYLRTRLAREVKVRTTPELHFVHDASVARGMHLTALIDAAVAGQSVSDEEEE